MFETGRRLFTTWQNPSHNLLLISHCSTSKASQVCSACKASPTFTSPALAVGIASTTGKGNMKTKELPRFATERGIRNYRLWLADLLAVLSFHLRMSLQTGSDLLHGPAGLLCYKIFLKAKKQQHSVRAVSNNHRRPWAVQFAPWGSQGECYDSFPPRICSCNLNIMRILQVQCSWL